MTASRAMTRAEAAAVLGIAESADRATAQRAYLRLARQVHPDAAPEAADADRFDALSRARAAFDRPVAPVPAPPPPPPGVWSRQPSARDGNALLILVLLVFLLVALVTLSSAIETDGFEQDTLPGGITTAV